MEDLSQYLVKTQKKILVHLKTLVTKKCLISASFGDHHSFLTAIIDIDEKTQTLTIDCGPKEYLNKKLLSSGIVNFKSESEGVKIFFRGHNIQKSGKMSEPSLSMKIPQSIYWVQRRKSYRVRSPLSKKSFCSITVQNDSIEETLDFQLFDLSATGFSILSETLEESEPLTLSSKFHNCELTLDDTEVHIISFSVQGKTPINANKPLKSQRIGCQFINLTPTMEASFLRYTQMIQREIKNNLG